ncbi:glycosyltransferase family 4 protein [Sunxiuqinia elliptica]|uniref:Glycosyltransferase involved in cell wall biosynthesis n=1 Tax=Sunxiuqinia elliptica TaxID=655355 RepID=A0A4R6H6W6_9BACT|nr:glycosyltransferase family 1 protein [Sunxiuqinia elliptica]TDO03950.1 glycosyltransferase involved in cell wall biosynthesis [Sunxiuqinia elliptica]TDO62232.1 glycosyltransferase involved in cell wall biosynthesis [Sunxiuqinia elliptica]
MIIAVNTRLLQKGKLEGIGWFTRETLSRITRNHPEHQFLFLFDRPYDEEFVFSDNVTPLVIAPPTRHPLLWYLWFEIMVPRVLRKYKADLFLSPDGYLSLSTKVKQLAVIHDINFAHRPKDLPWLTAHYYNHFFPKFAKKAKRLATVSYYSKEDLIRTYKIHPDDIDVVYNGVNTLYTPTTSEEQEATRQKYTDGKQYFLYIGSLHPRKNICGLLRAFDAFRTSMETDIKLVITGGEMFKTEEISKTYEGMRFKEDVVFTGRLPIEELHQVLGAALALTFVPYFEGFGIPVIEGMSAGIPVICSNTTSLPEVGGNAVLYADPFVVSQIKDAMVQIASDETLREELIQKGKKQLQQFSWDKTADHLWGSIQICLNT